MKLPRDSDLYLRFKDFPASVEGRCHARVWLPKGKIEGNIYAAVMFHGGGFTVGDAVNVPPAEVDWFNSQGTVVVSLQYRLAPQARLPEIYEDIADGYQFVVQQLASSIPGAVKVVKTAVMGWSAGAACACMLVKSARERSLLIPSVVMGSYGLYDFNMGAKEHVELASGAGVDSAMEEMLKGRGQTEIVHSPPGQMTPRLQWLFAHLKARTLQSYLHSSPPPFDGTYSPFLNVSSLFPPTALLVACGDTQVPTAQSYNFAEKLKRAGVDCVVFEAEGMQHGRCELDDGSEEAGREHGIWWEEAILPALEWTQQKLRGVKGD